MGKGSATRERILELAEAAVLAKGFGATSIEELIVEAGITKSGFFYHFRDKNELARGLLERYSITLDELLEGTFGRARALSDDPLQVLLIGLALLAEHMSEMPEGHPGCLVASMSYQDRLFNRDVRAQVSNIAKNWTGYFVGMLDDVIAVYPSRDVVDSEQLARMICCTIDGGIVMSKAMDAPEVLPEQILMARNHIRLLFQPTAVQPRHTAVESAFDGTDRVVGVARPLYLGTDLRHGLS